MDVCLNRVTDALLGDDFITTVATVYVSVAPCSVFLSVVYTESLFVFFTLMGVYFLYCRGSLFLSSFLFGISTIIRSNGLITL